MRTSTLLYPFLAAFCYGMNPILAKLGLQSSNEPVFGACIGILAGVVVYAAYFFASGQAGQLFSLPRRAGVYFGLAGLASTLAIFSLFFALEYLPAVVVAPLTSVVPLVTLVLSHLVLHDSERITKADVAGTIFIVGGIALLVS